MHKKAFIYFAMLFILAGFFKSADSAIDNTTTTLAANGSIPILKGRITDMDGNPLPGVEVTLHSPRMGTSWALDHTKTDSNGDYLISPIKMFGGGIMDGTSGRSYNPALSLEHHQLISSDGNRVWDIDIPDLPDTIVYKDFTMIHGGTLEGIVVHPETRKPVAGLYLRVIVDEPGIYFARFPGTDAQGRFRASPLFPGRYIIDVNTLREPVIGEVEVTVNQTTQVELVFDRKRPPRWAELLAIGPPVTPQRGRPWTKQGWRAKEHTVGLAWLELDYDPPLNITNVRIHETAGPGAIIEVTLKDTNGEVILTTSEVEIGKGTPPIFSIVSFPLTSKPVKTVRIVQDTLKVKGENRIDGVEIVGPEGRGWAVDARASSAFGDRKVWKSHIDKREIVQKIREKYEKSSK